MSQTKIARDQVLPKYPGLDYISKHMAVDLLRRLVPGISRNHARVVLYRARIKPKHGNRFVRDCGFEGKIADCPNCEGTGINLGKRCGKKQG